MGLRCESCGVRSNPTAAAVSISLNFVDGGIRSGPLTLTVDACADRLDLSTVSVAFVDQSGQIPNRSFSFTSTEITSVTCSIVNNECRVLIIGMGLVTGEITPRQFILQVTDRPSPLPDRLQVFSITGFVSNTTLANLTPDLTFFGCPPTP
jgi:hypothetical protein